MKSVKSVLILWRNWLEWRPGRLSDIRRSLLREGRSGHVWELRWCGAHQTWIDCWCICSGTKQSIHSALSLPFKLCFLSGLSDLIYLHIYISNLYNSSREQTHKLSFRSASFLVLCMAVTGISIQGVGENNCKGHKGNVLIGVVVTQSWTFVKSHSSTDWNM